MKIFLDVLRRMVAVIIASVMGVLGAGSILGIEVWKTALLASITGISVIAEDLARAYLKDGKLDTAEINDAFAKMPDKDN
jgi:hypothetical protein